MKNTKVAAQLNELTKEMHNVEVTCNYQDNLSLYGKIEDVQKVIKELVESGLSVLYNDIPEKSNPYYDGWMTALVGKI